MLMKRATKNRGLKRIRKIHRLYHPTRYLVAIIHPPAFDDLSVPLPIPCICPSSSSSIHQLRTRHPSQALGHSGSASLQQRPIEVILTPSKARPSPTCANFGLVHLGLTDMVQTLARPASVLERERSRVVLGRTRVWTKELYLYLVSQDHTKYLSKILTWRRDWYYGYRKGHCSRCAVCFCRIETHVGRRCDVVSYSVAVTTSLLFVELLGPWFQVVSMRLMPQQRWLPGAVPLLTKRNR